MLSTKFHLNSECNWILSEMVVTVEVIILFTWSTSCNMSYLLCTSLQSVIMQFWVWRNAGWSCDGGGLVFVKDIFNISRWISFGLKGLKGGISVRKHKKVPCIEESNNLQSFLRLIMQHFHLLALSYSSP